jgi:GNAT superfamily N-acetyltransferase
MRVRLATEADIDDLAELTRAAMAEVRPWLTYDDYKARETFYRYLDTADPTIFVAEDADGIAGLVTASINEYRMSAGLFVLHEVIFVRPEKRGTRAAARLMKHLLEWGQTLGAVEVIGGCDSNFKSDKTARFMERFGFQSVGYSMRKVL